MTSKNTKTFEFRLGKTALILFVMGMSCLVFIAFVGGVLVGKHIDAYPQKIAREIPAKIAGGAGKTPAPATVPGAPAKPAVQAPAAQEEKAAPRPAPVSPIAEAPDTKGQAPAQSAGAGKVSPAATSAAEKAVPPEQKKAAEEPAVKKTPSERAPSAAEAAPPNGKGKYLLQVASYREKEKAEQVAGRLGAMGYVPRVVATDLREKGIWYRVQVGGFATREEARRASEAIAAKMGGVRSAVKPSLKGN